MAISNLVLTQQIYSEEPNGAHAHYREPVPLIAVRLLEPGHFDEDDSWITTFLARGKQRILKCFFANWPTKFKVRLAMEPLKNFKAVWTYLTFQETTLKFMNVIVSSAKNLKTESFAFKRRDWIIFVQLSRFEKCHCNPQHRQHYKQSKQRASNLERDQLTFFSLAIVAWISKYLFNVSRYGPLPWNCKRRLWGSHLNFTYSPFLLHLYRVYYDRIKWPSPVGSVAQLARRCTMQYHRDQDSDPEKPEFSQVFFSHLLNGRL